MQHILIVEDDLDIQDLLRNFLQEVGYEITIASDGMEAIALFSSAHFDLILLDIMLPKIDGFTVCELIRKQSQVPIIMLTALNGEEEQIRGLDLQVDDYITKPFSMPIQSMQQLHEKIADMNSRYYDLRGKIVKAERRIAILTERGEMWEQYNQYKSIHKQLVKVKPEKREQFEQRHSRELILYDAAARYLKELKDRGEGITPKAWQREIDQLAAGKQTDTLAMKAMREDLKAVERLRKTAEQLSRQERDKPHDRGSDR